MGFTPVTDPLILQQLSGEAPAAPLTPTGQSFAPVTDPLVLKQLGGNTKAPDMTTSGAMGVLHGALPFGLDSRAMAALAALHESLSGGLSFGKAYSQALPQYQDMKQAAQEAHPIASGVGEAAGSLPLMMVGGEAINAGLKGLGAEGRFLAGVPDLPSVGTTATGQFRALTDAEKAMQEFTRWGSRALQYGREGAQAGAFGAANNGQDIGEGIKQGALTGGALGAVAQPLTYAASRVADLPAQALGALPGWMKSFGGAALGTLGVGALHNDPSQLLHMATNHPVQAAGAASAAALVAMSKFLEAHPALRNALTRASVNVGGEVAGANQ